MAREGFGVALAVEKKREGDEEDDEKMGLREREGWLLLETVGTRGACGRARRLRQKETNMGGAAAQ